MPYIFGATDARRVLEVAAALPDNPRAMGRGPTYHAIFALCYGLGLRAGEACGLRIGDIDNRRQVLEVRGGKFGKSRLVPHGPRIGELLARQAGRRDGLDAPLFSFDGRRSVHPGSASQVFHRLVTDLAFPVPDGVSPPVLHCLRHSYVTHLIEFDYPEKFVSDQCGHATASTTSIYTGVSDEYRNGLLRKALSKRDANLWEGKK